MELVRSPRRRRTASAAVRDGQLVVRLPAHATEREQQQLVDALLGRLRRRVAGAPGPVPGLPDRVDPRPTTAPRGPRGDRWLVELADEVGDRWLEGERAAHVTWSSRMATRWASCTVTTRRVRISTRLADAPLDVVANTLLHELAHLRERGHGPAFAALLARDPRSPAVARWLERRSALETARVLRREGLLDGPGGDVPIAV